MSKENYKAYPNKKISLFSLALGIAVIVMAFILTGCNGGADPHGINGRWEMGGSILEFRGNRVTEYIYQEMIVDRQIAQADLSGNNGFDTIFSRGAAVGTTPIFGRRLWDGSPQGVTYELIEINQLDDPIQVFTEYNGNTPWTDIYTSTVAYTALVRQVREATFSITNDGRIEFVWQDERGVVVRDFQKTENTIDIGGIRYMREQSR